MKHATKAPSTCTFAEVLRMRSDNHSVGDFWILSDATTVWLTNQKNGEPVTQTIAIPRRTFNKLIAWYTKPQPIAPKCKDAK